MEGASFNSVLSVEKYSVVCIELDWLNKNTNLLHLERRPVHFLIVSDPKSLARNYFTLVVRSSVG